MKLIVTEKDSAAHKIAQILGDGVSTREHGRGKQKVRSYTFTWEGQEAVAIGLRGHVMETVFPDSFRRWSLKYMDQMIEEPKLAWVTDGGAVSTIAALREAARGADEVIIATDYDREGELIGEEALAILRGDALRRHPDDKGEKPKRKARRGSRAAGEGDGARKGAEAPRTPAADGDPRVKAMLPARIVDRHHRARYSALTPGEVKRAFDKLSTLDVSLAEAAHTRQDIDLIWGAVLTRFFSLVTYRYGADYLSIGRVQTPTLRLVVERERERLAFVPVPYWEVKADLETDGERLTAEHVHGRFATAAEAERALAGGRVETATVTAYRAEPRKLEPPTPFNTTGLMSAASNAGLTPARAMKAAESLYLDGIISYPRTDNTVYPSSLDLRGILAVLTKHQAVGAIAAGLAEQGKLTPTRGKKRDTAHPPIHPVEVPKSGLHGDQARVYDLVVRRFLATLLPAAVIESQRVDLLLGSEPFAARGSRVASPGFLRAWQPYTSQRDRPLPRLAEGDELTVVEVRSEAKETQPPARFGQGTLLEKMEELSLGTRATRADIIQHLYDRGYVRDNPVEPTRLGTALIDAFDAAMKDPPRDISSPAMTAELEREMDAISVNDLRRDAVVVESQKMLGQAHGQLATHADDIKRIILDALREDTILGVCANCGGELRVMRGKTTGKRFVACWGKEGEEPKVPEGSPPGTKPRRGCGQTFPLPQFGAIIPTGTTCPDCGWPQIKVLKSGGRGRPWTLCLDPDCPTKEKYARTKR